METKLQFYILKYDQNSCECAKIVRQNTQQFLLNTTVCSGLQLDMAH